jgi:hypothetical protein
MTSMTLKLPNRLTDRVRALAASHRIPADEAALELLAQSVAAAERIARLRARASGATVAAALAVLDELDRRDRRSRPAERRQRPKRR